MIQNWKKNIAAFTLICVPILQLHSQYTIHEGDIDGAPFKFAIPENWAGNQAFFHVHGWRPSDAPHEADLNPEDPLYAALLSEGWAIGRTAFLENGVDHPAHTHALKNLKTWLIENHGPLKTLILEGESTAATLVLRIAEKNPELADGVIAIGPFIDMSNPEEDDYLTGQPMLPSILMSNTSEIIPALEYAAKAIDAEVPAALWPLLRPGHVNVNWVERLTAVRAMESALKNNTQLSFNDGTQPMPHRLTNTQQVDNTLISAVESINPYYGNAFLAFHPDEFSAFGIPQGSYFEFEAHGNTWKVLYGTSYGDVPDGEWVAFPHANERILIVRNHASAIKTAGLNPGDRVTIRSMEQ
ncbi:MAG: SAM hydroxide adenosyltransferase [Verrucomicrobiota bacterium]